MVDVAGLALGIDGISIRTGETSVEQRNVGEADRAVAVEITTDAPDRAGAEHGDCRDCGK